MDVSPAFETPGYPKSSSFACDQSAALTEILDGLQNLLLVDLLAMWKSCPGAFRARDIRTFPSVASRHCKDGRSGSKTGLETWKLQSRAPVFCQSQEAVRLFRLFVCSSVRLPVRFMSMRPELNGGVEK